MDRYITLAHRNGDQHKFRQAASRWRTPMCMWRQKTVEMLMSSMMFHFPTQFSKRSRLEAPRSPSPSHRDVQQRPKWNFTACTYRSHPNREGQLKPKSRSTAEATLAFTLARWTRRKATPAWFTSWIRTRLKSRVCLVGAECTIHLHHQLDQSPKV